MGSAPILRRGASFDNTPASRLQSLSPEPAPADLVAIRLIQGNIEETRHADIDVLPELQWRLGW